MSALRRTSAPALQYAEAHLTMATAAVAASDLPRATQHLKAARELDNGRALEARLDALSAHVAIDERRTDDAERLAQAALVAAARCKTNIFGPVRRFRPSSSRRKAVTGPNT